MMYAKQRGLIDDNIFIWGFGNSQAVDMLKGAFGNIMRILNHAPIIMLTDSYSEVNKYASSTINIWSNSLIYAGIPWYVVGILVIPLLILIYLSGMLNPRSYYTFSRKDQDD